MGNKGEYEFVDSLVYEYNKTMFQEDDVFDSDKKEKWLFSPHLACSAVGQKITHTLEEQAVLLFEYINARDIARFDFRITGNGRVVLLEANSNPTITPTADPGIMCKLRGRPYENFISAYANVVQKRVSRG